MRAGRQGRVLAAIVHRKRSFKERPPPVEAVVLQKHNRPRDRRELEAVKC
jgi:hypothetical protein